MKFTEIVKDEALLGAIKDLGYEDLTKIQEEAMPIVFQGSDLLAQSQTGTGKTVCFALPTILNLDEEERTQVLVLTPTRELAIQVARSYKSLLKYTNYNVTTLFGGEEIRNQINSLKKKPQIVIATPGRLLDHLRRKTVKLNGIKTFILDEADEMLKMGFYEDVIDIFSHIQTQVQVLLFSATLPKTIQSLAERILKDPKQVRIEPEHITATTLSHYVSYVNRAKKQDALIRLLQYYQPKRALIFANTKSMVEEIFEFLKKKGFSVEAIHGDRPQSMRLKVLDRFHAGMYDMLVATDVAGRGLDIEEVDLVINYDVPEQEELYVHRIGRSGRKGNLGYAITLVSNRDRTRVSDIEKYINSSIEVKEIPNYEEVEQRRLYNLIQRSYEEKIDRRYRAMTEMLVDQGVSLFDICAYLLKQHIPLIDNTEDLNEREKKQNNRKKGKSRNRDSFRNKKTSKSGNRRRKRR